MDNYRNALKESAHVRVEQRTLDLIQYAETSGINRIEECAEGSLVNGKKIADE